MTVNNPKLDLVNNNVYTKFGQILSICSENIVRNDLSILMCIQNLVKFCPFILEILSGNEILLSIKGLNVTNLRKITIYNPNLDLINVNVHTKSA